MAVINTNITALIGQQNLTRSQSALQTSMERLSSGLRINSAADDAAGQAIANRMSAPLMSAETLARRPADQRAKMYTRLRGDFPTMKIKRVASSAEQIRAVVEDRDGNEAIFSFDFEKTAPFKIRGIAIDIGNVER